MSHPEGGPPIPPGLRSDADKFLYGEITTIKTNMSQISEKVDQIPVSIDSKLESVAGPLQAGLTSLAEGVRALPQISASLDALNQNLKGINQFKERFEVYENRVKKALAWVALLLITSTAGVVVSAFNLGGKATTLLKGVDELTKKVSELEKSDTESRISLTKHGQQLVNLEELAKSTKSTVQEITLSKNNANDKLDAIGKSLDASRETVTITKDAIALLNDATKKFAASENQIQEDIRNGNRSLNALLARVDTMANARRESRKIPLLLSSAQRMELNKETLRVTYEVSTSERVDEIKPNVIGTVLFQDSQIKLLVAPPQVLSVAQVIPFGKIRLVFSFDKKESIDRFEGLLGGREFRVVIEFPMN